MSKVWFDYSLSLTVSSFEIIPLLVSKHKVRAFQTTLITGGQSPRNIKAHNPRSSVFAHPQSSQHRQHALHTRHQLRCLHWPCRSSDHGSGRLPIPDRPVQCFRGQQAYVQTTLHLRSTSDSLTEYWCDQNEAQCPLICLQQPGVTSSTTEDNECDPVRLTTPLHGLRRCGEGLH